MYSVTTLEGMLLGLGMLLTITLLMLGVQFLLSARDADHHRRCRLSADRPAGHGRAGAGRVDAPVHRRHMLFGARHARRRTVPQGVSAGGGAIAALHSIVTRAR